MFVLTPIIIMETVFEILKFTIPGLIVFAAVYFIQRQQFQKEYQLKQLEGQGKYSKDAIPLKLQAYERLLLFCDRISIPNLLLRLKTREMSANDLKSAMVISVQKEYEHNLAQQLYTSNKLWEIITLAKNDVIAIISDTARENSNGHINDLAQALLSKVNQSNKNPLSVAIKAIKEEAKIILNV